MKINTRLKNQFVKTIRKLTSQKFFSIDTIKSEKRHFDIFIKFLNDKYDGVDEENWERRDQHSVYMKLTSQLKKIFEKQMKI